MTSSLRVLATCFLCAALLGRPARAGAESVTVAVSGLKAGVGKLEVMIWKDAAGFPTQPEKAVARKVVPVTATRMEVVLSGLPRGRYAVAAYQDLNGNGKLDRSLLGWPVEPVGASNGATSLVGPPSFGDAAFELKQAATAVEVKVK